jgi:predicted O-methyltransferase YrrM
MELSKRTQGLFAEFGLEWLSKNSFRLGDYDFYVPHSINDFLANNAKIEQDKFYVAKSQEIIQRYLMMIKERKPQTIVELGVFRGGSVAFLQLAAKPKRFLALEISPERVDLLDKFIQGEGVEVNNSLRVAYGVDQADAPLVRQITTEHLGEGRCIDLVFDDASHLLGPTRTSFEALFPLVRPGGSFIIEDYASTHILTSHWYRRAVEGSTLAQQIVTEGLRVGLQADRQPLQVMAIEAMLASIAAPGLVRKVIAERHWLRIVRGHKDFDDPNAFDLRSLAADHFGLLECRMSDELAKFVD